ncbi:amidase [Humibacillus xanthopallidus]|uniref:Amidase n=1 Tax=Humibacillus xanthopallidus TaxID=412689 RepID=A0A543PT00_9MICO|nr:amidase family protein [Humibacillus xanthopallidus]TQN47184.1 amidase [Humibacillus xanthopallidus]
MSVILDAARSVIASRWVARRVTTPDRLRPLDFAPFEAALATISGTDAERVSSLVEGADIASLATALDSGSLSARDLLLHHLARVRALDDRLRSILELNPRALDEARKSDERRAAGAARGPLDGIPLTVKDNIATAAPMHTTGGTFSLADHVADADAAVVAAVRAAGAVVLGTNNLSELAGAVSTTPGVSAVGGQTVNPHGPDVTPGGSSSGTAVAVAAGLTVVGIGTETSGSLLAPASFNGVVAMKPTHGLVPGAGIMPLVATQDDAGPVARTVADAAALLEAMTGGALRVEIVGSGPLPGSRVGVLRAEVLRQRSALEDTTDNGALLDRAARALEALGATCVEVEVADAKTAGAVEKDLVAVVLGGLSHETMAAVAAAGGPASVVELQRLGLADPERRIPRGQSFVSLAAVRRTTAEAHAAAAAALAERTRQLLGEAFEHSGADVLLSLSNVHSAFYASAGHPAVTVPLGLRSSGMPVGATLIGRRGADAEVLRWAGALEAATGARVSPRL